MHLHSQRTIGLAVLVSSAVIMSCSGESSSGPDDNGGGDEIKTGTAVTYQVASGVASVRDSVSGVTFVFPAGGSGSLKVAPVISGPEVGVTAKRMAVEYTGSGELAISVPHVEGNEEVVYVRGKIPNVVSIHGAQAGDEAWLGIAPSEKRADATVFNLAKVSLSGSGKRAATGTTAATVAVATVTAGSDPMARRTEARRLVTEAVAFWVNNLPRALADSARTLINGDMGCTITWSSDGNYYDHDIRSIYLQVDGDQDVRANAHTCAHEVGHYMTHVLVGRDRYVDMLNRMPSNWYGAILPHGFADYFEYRKYVVEEYAYLSDYLITGSVDGSNLTSPSVATMFGSSGPEVKDFPSFEGYGAIILGALLRTNPKVNSFWVKSTGASQAPVVGAPSGDVLALTARGARDTNELYTVMQSYLASRGYTDRDKLPAMLEPLGWSYHGSGKIVDAKGSPVQNATVQSISQNGSGEFRTPVSAPTGADGKFTLSRVFPGTNLIRVFSNSGKDSTTFQVTADSTKTTNAAIDFGTISLSPKPETKQLVLTGTQEFKIGDTLVARVKTILTVDVTGYGLKPHPIQTTAGLYMTPGMPVTVKISAASTVEMVNAKIGGNSWYYLYTLGQPKVIFQPMKYGTFTVTESRSDNAYSATFTFPGGGDMLHINTFTRTPETEEIYEDGSLARTNKGELTLPNGPSCYLYATQ